MTQNDDEFIKALAEKEAQKQQSENQAKQIQLHRKQILQAKLPLYFKDLHSLLDSKVKSYDQIVQANGGKSGTEIVPTGHGFQLRHRSDTIQALIGVSYDLLGQRISYSGHSGPLSYPEQNPQREIIFNLSVDENDNLLVLPLVSRGVPLSISPSQLADEIIKALVEP